MHNEDAPEPWIQGAEKPRDFEEYLNEVYWDVCNLKIVLAFLEIDGPVFNLWLVARRPGMGTPLDPGFQCTGKISACSALPTFNATAA